MTTKCPSCGATLTAAATATRVTCLHCGNSFRIRQRLPPDVPTSRLPTVSMTDDAAKKPPWSRWAWGALAVGLIAGLAPPGRLLWDIAAFVLGLVARYKIIGEHTWALTVKSPRKRGIWAANIAFLIGALDLLLVAWSVA